VVRPDLRRSDDRRTGNDRRICGHRTRRAVWQFVRDADLGRAAITLNESLRPSMAAAAAEGAEGEGAGHAVHQSTTRGLGSIGCKMWSTAADCRLLQPFRIAAPILNIAAAPGYLTRAELYSLGETDRSFKADDTSWRKRAKRRQSPPVGGRNGDQDSSIQVTSNDRVSGPAVAGRRWRSVLLSTMRSGGFALRPVRRSPSTSPSARAKKPQRERRGSLALRGPRGVETARCMR
jgi:hypothetical protein